VIVRGTIDLRLAGRRREIVATGLVEGLARLVVTGFFYRFVEVERTSALPTALALIDSIRAAHALTIRRRLDGMMAAAEAAAVVIEAESGEGPGALRLRMAAWSRHERGRPSVSIQLERMALPDEIAALDRGPAADAAVLHRRARQLAARILADRDLRDALLAGAVTRMEALQADLVRICGAAVPVDGHSCRTALAFPRGHSPDAEPERAPAAWHWLAALSAEGLAHPELVSDLPAWSADFGGSLDAGTIPAADGGGSFAGAPWAAPEAPAEDAAHPAPPDTGGGDL
jgi:hypothetical protein